MFAHFTSTPPNLQMLRFFSVHHHSGAIHLCGPHTASLKQTFTMRNTDDKRSYALLFHKRP